MQDMAGLVGGGLSTAELAVRADDEEVGELEPGVVVGAVRHLKPAQIDENNGLGGAEVELEDVGLAVDVGWVDAGRGEEVADEIGAYSLGRLDFVEQEMLIRILAAARTAPVARERRGSSRLLLRPRSRCAAFARADPRLPGGSRLRSRR